MWEKIKLSNNYLKALEQVCFKLNLKQIDKELMYWSKFQVHKCKQRLTRITQVLMKMRRLRSKTLPKLVAIKPKIERRERSREIKAESAARLEQTIQKELLERLKSGVYGDIYNFNQETFDQMLEEEEIEEEEEREFVEGYSDLESLEDIEDDNVAWDSDSDVNDNEGPSDEKPKKKKRRHMEIEFENENGRELVTNF
ncbi:Mak16-domain-containing protein [Rozella allomycis CSF55]|uniref:Mak16 protein domain-containing protein n=1 Tax=Rozella allomycis (strain CSF55) TaxID=988480 RepID=A0A075B1N1_ROZAC|nr:Mak16 protein domain-containing protein [Rozella allomycis CSF55]RKP18872.1 Mak16-domain-containing protein [Rozella allomycis CSF55]|eukprot:EPZ34876.1 Mak16 protein domain-containing protein [Rozella allomycis CSF55]